MYRLLVTTLAIILSGAASANPTTVNVAVERAFVPVGFDSNDRTQFAVEGTFHNTCYRVGPYALKVDSKLKTITMQQQAYKYDGMVCLQMMVPFTQVINVGILDEGNYKLLDATTGKQIGTLPVEKSVTAGPDSFLYAPVTDAYIVEGETAEKHTLVVTGSFGDRCSTFEDIKIGYQDNVLVVQPIVKRITEATCSSEKVRFLKTIDLREDLKGIYLLHVRSLNGQAINKMVEF